MKTPIYLDYAATTPVMPEVTEIMLSHLKNTFGNSSSTHAFGQSAKKSIENARAEVADLIQADPSEIIWTSGATEANNLALKGAAQLYQNQGKHIITMKTEHPAVLECCQYLEKQGFQVTYLSPRSNGVLDLSELKNTIRNDTILISIMHVNNETGVIQDIAEIAKMTSEANILFHVDAAQSAGKIPINLKNMPIDLMSFSAHKIYGPKGIGALFTRRKPRVRVAPQLHGGGQEQGMRSGTLATHQIAGMGAAFRLAKDHLTKDYEKVTKLRERFCQGLLELKNISFNSDVTHSIPHILNIRFHHHTSDEIISALPELAISAGSACFSKGVESSYVLRAMGQDEKTARNAVRFSLGRFTTSDEIDFALQKIYRMMAVKTQS